jgi:hypothetical protein
MDIKIPRRTITARVFFHRYGEEACDFFLAESSERHQGPETLDEFLNLDPREFIPIRMRDSGSIVLISKKFIEAATVPADSPALESDHGVPPTREAKLKVTMTDDRTYLGTLRIFGPAYEARVTDFMNAPGAFFQLHTEAGVCYINKFYLSRLEEI